MEKTLHFTNGEKSANIDISLENGRLSITGVVYTGKWLLKSERNLISCGQCLDECRDIIPAQLAEIWERWHLNDMKAGTYNQEKALDAVKCTFSRLDWYTEACNYLTSINLYEDNGYRYGSAWLTEELPTEVINYVSAL